MGYFSNGDPLSPIPQDLWEQSHFGNYENVSYTANNSLCNSGAGDNEEDAILDTVADASAEGSDLSFFADSDDEEVTAV